MRGSIKQKDKLRIQYAVNFILLLLIEVVIALFVHDEVIRPYGGDILVVAVVYCFIRIFVPERCRLLPLFVFLFAVLVEGLQSLQLVRLLQVESNPFLRTLIGSVFDWNDILCYAVGCVALVGYEVWRWWKEKQQNRRSEK